MVIKAVNLLLPLTLLSQKNRQLICIILRAGSHMNMPFNVSLLPFYYAIRIMLFLTTWSDKLNRAEFNHILSRRSSAGLTIWTELQVLAIIICTSLNLTFNYPSPQRRHKLCTCIKNNWINWNCSHLIEQREVEVTNLPRLGTQLLI